MNEGAGLAVSITNFNMPKLPNKLQAIIGPLDQSDLMDKRCFSLKISGDIPLHTVTSLNSPIKSSQLANDDINRQTLNE
jgi:hypothetical protein